MLGETALIVKKAFKFRIYPNQEQRDALAVQFGHARFVYNHYRAVREGYYLDTGTGIGYRDCADDLADILKVEHPWLCDADSQVLQQALKDLDRAYENFFDGRAGYPNFRSKHDKQSIRNGSGSTATKPICQKSVGSRPYSIARLRVR